METFVHDDILQGRLQAVVTRLDASASPAALLYYPAPRAPSLADVPSNPPIAVQILEQPCGIATPTELTLTEPSMPAQVLVSGDIGWARFVDGDGVPLMDVDAAEDDGTGTQTQPVLVSRINMITGAFVLLVSAVFR